MCLHVLIHKLQLPVAIFPAHMPSMQLTLLFPAPLQDRHVQGEIMNHRSLDHPNIIRSKEMDEHVQREIMNHSSLKNPNIIRFQEIKKIPELEELMEALHSAVPHVLKASCNLLLDGIVRRHAN